MKFPTWQIEIEGKSRLLFWMIGASSMGICGRKKEDCAVQTGHGKMCLNIYIV